MEKQKNSLLNQPFETIALTHNQSDKVVVDLENLTPSKQKETIHVLHVDDDPSLQEITKLILLDLDSSFKIDWACCVDDAFKKLASGHYDVVVSDYEMPQKDGLQFLEEFHAKGYELPFILFTGKGREEIAVKALNLSANGYFTKHGNPETVYGELAHGIQQSFEYKKAEEKLGFFKTFHENFVNSVGDALLVIDANNFRIISVNNAALKQLKASKFDLIGKTCHEITHDRSTPCEPPYDICQMHEMLTTGQPVTVEHQHFDPGNRRIVVEVSVHPVKGKDGEIVQVVHISKDITVRKEQESAERAKSNEIQGIVEGIGDLLFVIDKNRVITKVNKAACEFFKKTSEELIGRHCFEIVHNTDSPWCNCPASKTFETKQIVTEEVDDPNLGIPLLVTTSPVLDEQGEVAQIIHIAKDITKMKEAEMEVHIAANLFGAASDSILVHELDGKLVYFNEAAYTTRGYTRDEFQTLTIKDLEVPDNPRFFGVRMNELVEKGEATFEAFNLRKDKTVMPVEVHAQVIESDGRKLVLSVARDISERKVAEEKLAESQEKYKTSFESSMDALMLLDEKSFLDCNAKTLHLFGFSSVEEFSKKHPADLSPLLQPDGLSSLESAINHIQKAFCSGKESFFWIHKCTDGTTFPADVLLSRIALKNRVILQATVRDITEQKGAEEKLKEAEEKHRTLLAAANVLVQSVDAGGKFVFVNEEWKKVLGYTDQDLEEITIMNVIQKDHLEHCMRIFNQVMNGACIHDVETAFVTKNGKEIFVSGNACPIFKDKKIVSTVAFFVDITQRKKNEDKIQEDNRRIELMVEKLRVVGGLTRHDVRNKLAAVTGYSYLLKKKFAGQDDILDRLDKIELAVKDSVKIFEFAKMYEQLGVEELTYVDVENVVNEAAEMFSGLNVKVANECQGLVVLADSFLRQMFYNFIDNTRKYGKKTTAIRVHYEMVESGGVRLIYEDDGQGISTENKLRLFSEGFSTGGSTGFGLFLTKKMIDVYGWTIQELGEPEKGAKFEISIPVISPNGKDNYQISQFS
jgi:PAS domain S-box-containing protein